MRKIQVKNYNLKDFPKLLDKEVYIFPLLDGIKISIWMDKNGILHMQDSKGEILLTQEESIKNKIYIITLNWSLLNRFLKENQIIENGEIIQDFIIEGVWLFPQNNTLYNDTYLKHFLITDVIKRIQILDRNNFNKKIYLYSYQNYFSYKRQLEKYKLHYAQLIDRGRFSENNLIIYANHNVLYLQQGVICGPGIVIKNYDYYAKGQQIFAKIKSDYYGRNEKM
jgi:hypothetical protein